MSMQPMFTIQSSASSSLTSGKSIHRFVRSLSLCETFAWNVEIHSGMCFGASFWKNASLYAPCG